MRNDKDFKVDRFYGVFKLKLLLFYKFGMFIILKQIINRKRRGITGDFFIFAGFKGRGEKLRKGRRNILLFNATESLRTLEVKPFYPEKEGKAESPYSSRS